MEKYKGFLIPVKFETRETTDASGSVTTLEIANGEVLGYSRAVDSETYEKKGFVYIPGLGWCTEEEE